MAAAILEHLAGHQVHAASAGARMGYVDPYVIAVMDEIGIDISEHEPRALSDIGDELYDFIITLSPEAHHHAIELTRVMATEVEYWPTSDVTVFADLEDRRQRLAHYRNVRDGLFRRIQSRFSLENRGVTV